MPNKHRTDEELAINRIVGQNLKYLRKLNNLNQTKVGNALKVSFQQIQKYEKGTNRIGASRLQHIATVMAVPVSFFFEDAPGTPAEAASLAENRPANYIVDFLSSSEGVQLNKAFVRIKDAKLRRRIIDLVRAAAGDENSN